MTPAEARTRLGALPAAAAAALADQLGAVAETVAEEARRQLGAVAPSQPGAPPADPAGRLADVIVASHDGDGSAAVRVDAPYAADLEYGTRRMAARPFLRPAVAAMSGDARRNLADALARAVASTFGAGP